MHEGVGLVGNKGIYIFYRGMQGLCFRIPYEPPVSVPI